MLTRTRVASLVALIYFSGWGAWAQGSFQNLGFEQARVTITPIGQWGGEVDPTLAFPGWTVGGGSWTFVSYNDYALGSPAVNLIGPRFPNAPGLMSLQGAYSVMLQYIGAGEPPTLSQTGLIPTNARSISFIAANGTSLTSAVVTVNGNYIPIYHSAGLRMAGDISAYAGSVATLAFSTSAQMAIIGLYFDDVQFSSEPIPEPSSLSLFGICSFVVWWRMKRPKCAPARRRPVSPSGPLQPLHLP